MIERAERFEPRREAGGFGQQGRQRLAAGLANGESHAGQRRDRLPDDVPDAGVERARLGQVPAGRAGIVAPLGDLPAQQQRRRQLERHVQAPERRRPRVMQASAASASRLSAR